MSNTAEGVRRKQRDASVSSHAAPVGIDAPDELPGCAASLVVLHKCASRKEAMLRPQARPNSPELNAQQ